MENYPSKTLLFVAEKIEKEIEKNPYGFFFAESYSEWVTKASESECAALEDRAYNEWKDAQIEKGL